MTPYRTLEIKQAFFDFIGQSHFPCVGAKSAIANGGLEVHVAADICQSGDDAFIHAALVRGMDRAHAGGSRLKSMAVVFDRYHATSEEEFEAQLWQRLDALAGIDRTLGVPWSAAVSNDPRSPNYAFSLGGEAYFVIGVHPLASRAARRFSRAAIVFNAHKQFSEMRTDGRYQRFQSVTRARELRAQGSINPMLRDFGAASEAPQYSGRCVEADWICPIPRQDADAL